ncbi:MAG TPA: DUF1998 domain-containing protein [Kiritimatiellia bacterium]|nr:DUF1998 domain-containing protein [Kiritimatiellia bacterium]
MQLNNVRRSAFIAPFGPGALQVLRDGVSVLTAGLDHWMQTNANPAGSGVDVQEFQIREWRLEKQLGVDYFLQPPDFRRPPPKFAPVAVPNACLTIPVLRFPTWYVCRFCNRMHRSRLDVQGRIFCPECQAQRKRVRMSQVRFIALCDQGHLQDFPWMQWVHRNAAPPCSGPIYFDVRGSGLGDIQIRCKGCGMTRRMEQITSASPDGSQSYLSTNLLNDEDGKHNGLFLCQGCKPWLGTEEQTGCSRPLRGALRSATNVHYSEVRSAIYLPSTLFTPSGDPSAAAQALREPVFSVIMAALRDNVFAVEEAVPKCRAKSADRLKPYKDTDIAAALYAILDRPSPAEASTPVEQTTADDDPWTAFRRTEFNVLMRAQNEPDLVIAPAPAGSFSTSAGQLLSAVHLVSKLRETRVFAGFTRIIAGGPPDDAGKIAALRSAHPEAGALWLPAYCVYGEGIFITLSETALQAWEQRPDVRKRAASLNTRNLLSATEHNRPVTREVSARRVLLHTLSHVLINRLNYECGYSSASLRERLYVSTDKAHPMAGILIYTSSGDSEGTLGGLVRMGKPDEFERILLRAIEGSRWCSADPVCMESADQGGQGPDGLNGAACHGCSLLPETSCEEFNRLLDRGMLIGSFSNPNLGFFT